MKRTLIYMFAAMSLVGSSCSGDWLNLNPSTHYPIYLTAQKALMRILHHIRVSIYLCLRNR